MTKNAPLNVVYTVGKVGTYTMHAVLRQLLPVNNVYRAHALTDQGIKEYERFKGITAKRERRTKMVINKHQSKTIKAVTLTRDPVYREVSSLFHNIGIYFPNTCKSEITVDEITRVLISNIDSHKYALNWFKEEMGSFLGINVYDYKFPHEKGYHIIKNRNAEVLVIRLEDLNYCFTDAMNDFFGLNVGGHLEHRNKASEKSYSKIYNRFMNDVKLPINFIEYFYSSQFAQHFYSQNELESFRRKWL